MDNTKTGGFPFEINDLDPELNSELNKYITGKQGFVQVGPKKYVLPTKYKLVAANIYNMEIKATDIMVAGYPRSGTHWTQELVWMIANDLNYAKSDAVLLSLRYILLENSMVWDSQRYEEFKDEVKDNEKNDNFLKQFCMPLSERLAAAPSSRFLKSHLPLSLLPPDLIKKGKIVYVARDPRDVAVSLYKLFNSLRTRNIIGDFKTYWNFFINDFEYWSPYFENVKEFWNKRNDPNLLFIFYEELLKDLPAQIRRVAKFLNKQYSEEQINELCEHLSMARCKNNKSLNNDNLFEIIKVQKPGAEPFFRQGKSGGWRDCFDEEMMQQAERWMAENLKDTDFMFPHLVDKM